MRFFRVIVICFLILVAFVRFIEDGLFLHFTITIYGGFFLLILDEALNFLKKKFG